MKYGKVMRFLCLLIAVVILITSCGEKDTTGKYPLSADGEAVINDKNLKSSFKVDDNFRVFYEIFTGSFSDSDGDGIGDLRGIINRFDYLNDGNPSSGLSLGVEGIWLTPIFKSPTYHKYDVQDYYEIDPQFGTMDDFKELIELCHKRNVKIIIDLPINHTSSKNAWFTRFTTAHKNGTVSDDYYDFYCYGSTPSQQGRSFAKISGTSEYYECNFDTAMPELNFDNEAVRAEVLNIAKYYLEMGVDGFRFDAAKYIYYGDEQKSAEFWKWYVPELKKINKDVFTVGEVWAADSITNVYQPYLNCFDFSVSSPNGMLADVAKQGNASLYTNYVEKYVDKLNGLSDDGIMMAFLSNHDMDRSAGYLTVASGYAKMAANLYILSPGSPFIYYGEEIGLKGSRGSANTDANRRLAMLWGDGDTIKDPVGTTYNPKSQTNGTVAELKGNGDSLYNHYKKLIMIRNANPEIARGEYKSLKFKEDKIGGFASTWNGSTIIVIHNTTSDTVTIDLSTVTDIKIKEIRAVIGIGDAKLEGNILTLGEQASVVLK